MLIKPIVFENIKFIPSIIVEDLTLIFSKSNYCFLNLKYSSTFYHFKYNFCILLIITIEDDQKSITIIRLNFLE